MSTQWAGGETVHLISAVGGDGVFVRADVTQPAEVEALAYAKTNIRVNAICPGYTDKPMVARHAELAARAAEVTR